MKALVSIAALVAIVMMLFFGYHKWYVDTHCTMVLGTQVCDTSSNSQPAPSPAHTIFVNVNKQAPYPTGPGQGPNGMTCYPPSTGMQACS